MSNKRKQNNSKSEEAPTDTYPKGHQIKKLSKGTVFNTTSKIIILNVYKYFRTKSYDVNVSEAVRLTVNATGCSPTSVYQLRKEESSKDGLREPSKKRIRKGVHKLSRDLKYDDTVRTAIRHIVQELKSKEVIPSLTTILEHIKNTNGMGNEQLQSMAPWTLRRLIFDLGFIYKKDGNKKILVDKMIDKKVKKTKVKDKEIDKKVKKSMVKEISVEPATLLQNQNSSITPATNVFHTSQFEDKNQYMIYEPIKTNNIIIQLHHQPQLPQENMQSAMCNNLMVQMPPPIVSAGIHHSDIELLPSNNTDAPSAKLMVLTSHSTMPWSC